MDPVKECKIPIFIISLVFLGFADEKYQKSPIAVAKQAAIISTITRTRHLIDIGPESFIGILLKYHWLAN